MSEPVLVVRARRLQAARGVVVARDVTLDAAPGAVVAVEGPNGSGKSTLLAAAAGLLPVDNASVRPGSVGYSPERAGVLPRIPLQRWLLGLARTAGLGREESVRRSGDLLVRLGLAHASAGATLAGSAPAGAMPAGSAPAGTMEVETGDGTVRLVDEAGLPAVLDAGQAIRRVQPACVPDFPADGADGRAADGAADGTGAAPRRAGATPRMLYGAAHRARLLASSQWFLAPALVFLIVLGITYAGDAGPPLQAAAVTAIPLVPVLTWLSVLAHRVDGRELARAFAAHAGGRARAHLATDLGLVPFAVLLALAALVAPLISQGSHPHSLMLDVRIVGLHLAAAVFGAGLGSLLALIERAGWRLLTAVAAFLVLFVVRDTPMGPLLTLSTHPTTLQTPVGGPAAWLCLPGLGLVAVAALLATRLT